MKELLRALPKVDELLRSPELAQSCREFGERAVADSIRAEVNTLRQDILAEKTDILPDRETLIQAVIRRAQRALRME